MSGEPVEPGDIVTFQYIMGEPSPYWVDGKTGKVVDTRGSNPARKLTIETENGETVEKQIGGSVSYKIVQKVKA